MNDLEQYYNQLCSNCDAEILRLKEEFDQVQAEDRTAVAEELVHTHDELERLGNFFIDCVYAARKQMRLRLIRQEDDPRRKPVEHQRLLDTYLRIVQKGAPDEIDRFSKIERQKLVELLCTNQDLLNHIFDTMFVTKTSESIDDIKTR